MYHSLTFKYKQYGRDVLFNTWDSGHLIPTSRPTLAQPSPNYKFVDIPGADGSYDMTDYLIGRPTYTDRQGTFEFYVMNGYGDWTERRTHLAHVFDGKQMKLYLEDEPDYYYIGRFMFKAWTPEAQRSKVTIEYRIRPYRYNSNDQEAGL